MTTTPTSTINTAGGAIIDGSVTAGGDFIGRDQVNIDIHFPPATAGHASATPTIYLLNFTRPLTPVQRSQIEAQLGQRLAQVIEQMARFVEDLPFDRQCVRLIDGVGLTPHEWQTLPILVHLPGFAPGAACLLAELHGRMGHFPALVRLRPLPDRLPADYAVAEIINLQAVRHAARERQS